MCVRVVQLLLVTMILIRSEHKSSFHLGFVVFKCGRSEAVSVQLCLHGGKARTQLELESSDCTKCVPTQTPAWLLPWSIKRETERQSVSWLRRGTEHLSSMHIHATLGRIHACLCLLRISHFTPHPGSL